MSRESSGAFSPPAQHRPLRAGLVTAILALTLCAPGSAYSKFEHEQLTYYAFELAKRISCNGDGTGICSGFGDVPPTKLGAVTRAVDYFSNPWRLAPVAAACKGDDETRALHGGCRDDVYKACAELGDRDCLNKALEHALEVVQKRRSKRLYRALAVHRNDEHFRRGARDQYNLMHLRAIGLARDGHFALALVAEAVAIHFLQDAFSPGHLAAPRDQYGDSHAGALHDRANGEGLWMWADNASLCRSARALRQPLTALAGPANADDLHQNFEVVTLKRQATPGAGPTLLKQIPKSKQIPPCALKEDLSLFTSRFCQTGGSIQYEAFGDKRLLQGRSGEHPSTSNNSRPPHRISLLALTVRSIRDVLEFDTSGQAPLRVCYHPPSLLVGAGEGKSTASDEIYWAPGLAIGPRYGKWYERAPCWKERQPELIYGYRKLPWSSPAVAESEDAGATTMQRYDLRAGVHRVNGLQVALSWWGEERKRFEIGHDVIATEKYWKREGDQLLDEGAGWRAVGTAGYVLHYEEEGDVEIQGAGLLMASGTQFRDFDLYIALEPGIGYYSYPGGDTTVFRWSARAGIGLSLIALEAMVERGLALNASGGLESDWRPSLNARFRLAPSWFKIPFRLLKRDE